MRICEVELEHESVCRKIESGMQKIGSRYRCNLLEYIDRSTITRFERESEDDVVSMSFSYRLHVVFICFVPDTGKRVIMLGVSMTMHGRQGSTTPDHGIDAPV